MSKSTEDLLRELESEGVFGAPKSGPPSPALKQPATASVRPARGRFRESTLMFVILAVILIALVGSLPFASYLLYPFSLLVTLIHETSHAIAAVATGGSVSSIKVSGDLSGVTLTHGGVEALIASAGYIGATVAGVALLLAPIRFARYAVGALAAIPLAALIFFHPADSFTTIWSIVFAAGLLAGAWKLRPRLAAFLQIFLGVEAGLNAFRDLMTLIFVSSDSHIHSDAVNMSSALFLPPLFWAIAWTVVSVALLVGTLVKVGRRDLSVLRRT